MTRRAKIGSSIFALSFLTAAATVLVLRGDRPTANSLVDRTVLLLTGKDLETRCWRREHVLATETKAFIGARRCYAFAPPQIFNGIYVDEFEGHRFVPIDWPSGREYTEPSTLFEVDEVSDLRMVPMFASNLRKRDGENRLWRVQFIGREAAEPGHYGHMGMSKRLLLVDRMVRADLLATYDDYLPDDVDPRTISSDNRR